MCDQLLPILLTGLRCSDRLISEILVINLFGSSQSGVYVLEVKKWLIWWGSMFPQYSSRILESRVCIWLGGGTKSPVICLVYFTLVCKLPFSLTSNYLV